MNPESISNRFNRLDNAGYGLQGGNSADHMEALRWAIAEGRGGEDYSPSIIAQWRRARIDTEMRIGE